MCEEVIKEVTASVLKYILPDDWSEEKKEANPIAAKKVVEAINDGKNVEIINAVIDGPLKLKSLNVEGEVTIQRTKIRGPIDWSYAAFKRVLNLENSIFETDVTFTTVTVEKDIFLDGATFCEKAKFSNITVMGVFYSQSTTFRKDVIFTDGTFKKRIKFSKSTFEGAANFVSARTGINAVFTRAEFKQRASFNSAQIEGSAFFNPATFEGDANFGSTRIGSNAVFTRAEFKQHAYFDSAQIERESHFEETVFANDVSFQDTSLKTVFFGEPNVQFHEKIDLRGCIYDRIQPISFWEQLMEHLGPYDRQPFTQLEEIFRRAGKDKLADDVYYMRKRRESAQKTIRKPGAWVLDRFLWLLTGYGVRLYRLLLAIVPILIIGTFFFHLEGAVTLDIQPHSMMSSQVTLPWCEAFWVSLNTFLPIEIPSGADWKPSSQIIPVLGIKFTTFATMLDLSGWILVPVGVAGIAGLLKRSK